MYVPSDFKFGPEIILPKENGLLIFASDGENFLLEENEERSCHKVKQMDKAAHFKGSMSHNYIEVIIHKCITQKLPIVQLY